MLIEENRVLSSHGPFSSTSVHPVADAETQQHVANMHGEHGGGGQEMSYIRLLWMKTADGIQRSERRSVYLQ